MSGAKARWLRIASGGVCSTRPRPVVTWGSALIIIAAPTPRTAPGGHPLGASLQQSKTHPLLPPEASPPRPHHAIRRRGRRSRVLFSYAPAPLRVTTGDDYVD
jgi:hypothetical protein